MQPARTIDQREGKAGFGERFLQAVEEQPARQTREQQVTAILQEAKPGIEAALRKNIPLSELHKLLLGALPDGSVKPSLAEVREAAGLAKKRKKKA